jgi:hypothetical protein
MQSNKEDLVNSTASSNSLISFWQLIMLENAPEQTAYEVKVGNEIKVYEI